jgi:hypothetical protein
VGSSYWLVVNNPNIVYQSLSATSYQSATNATIIDLGELAQYNQGFQDWTVIGEWLRGRVGGEIEGPLECAGADAEADGVERGLV